MHSLTLWNSNIPSSSHHLPFFDFIGSWTFHNANESSNSKSLWSLTISLWVNGVNTVSEIRDIYVDSLSNWVHVWDASLCFSHVLLPEGAENASQPTYFGLHIAGQMTVAPRPSLLSDSCVWRKSHVSSPRGYRNEIIQMGSLNSTSPSLMSGSCTVTIIMTACLVLVKWCLPGFHTATSHCALTVGWARGMDGWMDRRKKIFIFICALTHLQCSVSLSPSTSTTSNTSKYSSHITLSWGSGHQCLSFWEKLFV